MTQETTMQTEPMNVDTKDLSCAEALELAIAETRLALAEFGDRADLEIPGDARREHFYMKVDAGLDRCKAAADAMAGHNCVLAMANSIAGQQLRRQAEILRSNLGAYPAEQDERDEIISAEGTAICWPCLGWMAFATLLGMGIEFANGFIARASGWLL